MTEDRRQFERVDYQGEAILTWGGHPPVTVEVENLSLKGVLLRNVPEGQAPATGETAKLAISLSDEAQVNMSLEVAFLSGSRLGAKWTEIDVDGLTHLRRLIALNLGDAARVDEELAQMLHPEA
jgi:hypothetical protein